MTYELLQILLIYVFILMLLALYVLYFYSLILPIEVIQVYLSFLVIAFYLWLLAVLDIRAHYIKLESAKITKFNISEAQRKHKVIPGEFPMEIDYSIIKPPKPPVPSEDTIASITNFFSSDFAKVLGVFIVLGLLYYLVKATPEDPELAQSIVKHPPRLNVPNDSLNVLNEASRSEHLSKLINTYDTNKLKPNVFANSTAINNIEAPSIPIEAPSIPIEAPSIPIEAPSIPIEQFPIRPIDPFEPIDPLNPIVDAKIKFEYMFNIIDNKFNDIAHRIDTIENLLYQVKQTQIETTRNINIPPASIDIPPASIDIPPASIDIPPASIDIPPASIDPTIIDISCEDPFYDFKI